MKITAEQKFVRMSPRKVRLASMGLRGMQPEQAIKELAYVPRRAAQPVSKVIRQAMANATNNLRLSPQSLRVSEILINEGPTYKRFRAVSRGRAHSILKRTSHIKVILETVAPKVANVVATKTTTKSEGKKADSKKTDTKVATKSVKKTTKTSTKAAAKKAKPKSKATSTKTKKTTK